MIITEIKDTRSYKLFGNISYGDIFLNNGIWFIKIAPIYENKKIIATALALKTALLFYFLDDEKVLLDEKAEVIVHP